MRMLLLKQKLFISIILILIPSFFASQLSAMVFDNRYFPLIQYPYIQVPGKESHIRGDFFITTASRATDNGEREIGIPELSGPFDQSQLAYSMVLAGLPSLLPPGFINGSLPWTLLGKLQTQGFAFSWEQYFGYCFSLGVLGMAMRSNSSIEYYFQNSKASGQTQILSESDINELDEIRRAMIQLLGLSCNHVQQGGFGDIEAYARWASRCDFCFKLRSLEYAFRFGTLIPTGVKRDINQPASVPFGGNGHWGVYISADGTAELKEDWKVGWLLRLSKRFAQTRNERMPVAHPLISDKIQLSEPQIFGVITGPVTITPGWSEIFYIFSQWEGIRDGLGVRLQYTLINHNKDEWVDERIDKTIPVQLGPVQERSAWASEYVTLSAFYDFNRIACPWETKPIVRGSWDIPFTLLVGNRFVHSYKVSLGLEFNF